MASENKTKQPKTVKTETAPAVEGAAAAPKVRKKNAKKVANGIAVINATFNNTLITIATPNGDVLTRASAGALGFKGARKSTPYAAQMVAERVAKLAQEMHGLKCLDVVNVKGPGAGRDSAIRGLRSAGLEIKRLRDVTPLPHNGCRPRKKRRV